MRRKKNSSMTRVEKINTTGENSFVLSLLIHPTNENFSLLTSTEIDEIFHDRGNIAAKCESPHPHPDGETYISTKTIFSRKRMLKANMLMLHITHKSSHKLWRKIYTFFAFLKFLFILRAQGAIVESESALNTSVSAG